MSIQQPDRWQVELQAIREELQQMRTEQREMATAISELVTTFRTLATHLGIASEPYVRKADRGATRDLPGFG
jgi:prefoldin subunit 5